MIIYSLNNTPSSIAYGKYSNSGYTLHKVYKIQAIIVLVYSSGASFPTVYIEKTGQMAIVVLLEYNPCLGLLCSKITTFS